MNLWWVNRSVPVIHTVRRMLGPVVFLPKKRELPPFLFSQTLREALETRVKSHKKKKKKKKKSRFCRGRKKILLKQAFFF